jgi:parallel beta-helix repeat protein
MTAALRPIRPVAPALRRVTRSVLFAAATLVAFGAQAIAQTFYVDNQSLAASDANPGTELQPYLTILAAVTANKGPGITIVVKPGVYREQISVPASGAAGLPYTIQASGPGVVMDGSDDLGGVANWTAATGTEFLAAGVTWAPNQVFVDGARLAASAASPGSLPANSFTYVAGQGLYVNLGGDNPGAHEVAVSRRNYAFTMSNRSFVTISGFTIQRTNDRGINMHTCADVVISGNTVRFAGSYGIHAINSQRMLIESNLSTDNGLHGIGLTAATTASTVRNNECARNAHPTTRVANGFYLFGAPGNTLEGNTAHHNQDTGFQFNGGSNDCVSLNNRSWANGDHGYDHLASSGVIHVHDVSFGNWLDGFSFEGNSPNGQVHNCISVDNGLIASGHDLWVDAASFVGFVSNHNLFWNSTLQPIVRIDATTHATLATYQAATGLDANSVQANPLFVNAAAGDLSLGKGSPAIDAANSAAPNWPVTDAIGGVRVDDPSTLNTGAGPVAFADMGALEYVPADLPPIVTSPNLVKVLRGGVVTFRVTARDPDGDPIQYLVMDPLRLPSGAVATFITSADNTFGTFAWATLLTPAGNYFVRFRGGNWAADTSVTHIQVRRRAGAEEYADPGAGFTGPLALSNGFPNPSPDEIHFTLSLPEEGDVTWGVYDMQGREIFSESRSESPGQVQLYWSGRDQGGRRAPTGMYFARVKAGGQQFVRRIVHF